MSVLRSFGNLLSIQLLEEALFSQSLHLIKFEWKLILTIYPLPELHLLLACSYEIVVLMRNDGLSRGTWKKEQRKKWLSNLFQLTKAKLISIRMAGRVEVGGSYSGTGHSLSNPTAAAVEKLSVAKFIRLIDSQWRQEANSVDLPARLTTTETHPN